MGALKSGDHAGDSVVECGLTLQIGLPETGEEIEVVLPAALVKVFANGVRDIRVSRDAGGGNWLGNATFLPASSREA